MSYSILCTFTPGVEEHVNVIVRCVWWSVLSRWALCYDDEFIPSNTSAWQGIHRQFECVFCLFHNLCLPGVSFKFGHYRNGHVTVLVRWWDVTCKTHKNKKYDEIFIVFNYELNHLNLCSGFCFKSDLGNFQSEGWQHHGRKMTKQTRAWLTESELQVKLVGLGIERSWQLDTHLEALSSTDDEALAMETVCVMLQTIWSFSGSEEVNGMYPQNRIWKVLLY